ncbi:MAG: hypothetical protein WBA23_00410 [Tunicatimonas sp.]|uniref:hypothetical protein n=1 Tax=Tunicatimonas sp. TaxID=1940096 RepID=UPI003C7412D0
MFAHKKSVQSNANESLLHPAAQVYDWGSTLVVAPHPTADVLGCGGAVALLQQAGFSVRIVFVGDGEVADDQPNEGSTAKAILCQKWKMSASAMKLLPFLIFGKTLLAFRYKGGN